MTSVYEFKTSPVNTLASANPPVLDSYFPNKRWSVKFLLWMSGGAGTWGRLLCHGTTFTSTSNWSLGISDTNLYYIEANDQSWSYAHTTALPENQWVELEAGWDGANVYLTIDGQRRQQEQADWPIPALEDGFLIFDDLNASSARRIQISNIRHTLNDETVTVTYLCNEGGGTVFTEEDQGWSGTLTDVAIHATAEAGHPGLGAPASGQFGPVSTNKDGDVQTWQWEESTNDTDWQNVGTIITDISGQNTNTLTVNTATAAMHNTFVRCTADTGTQQAVSASAKLLIEGEAP